MGPTEPNVDPTEVVLELPLFNCFVFFFKFSLFTPGYSRDLSRGLDLSRR